MAVNVVQKRLMSMQKWAYNLSGFNKYGLMRDDLRHEDYDPAVREALRRLPQHKRDERNFRMLRAIQLDIQNDVLPRNQWTTLEKDELYLTPLVKQVEKEYAEEEEWNKKY